MKILRFAIVRQRYRLDGGAEKFITSVLEALSLLKMINLNIITREWEHKTEAHWKIHLCNPIQWGRVSRERDFAKIARALWHREGFQIVQSHERIAGCDIYRAGDGVHTKWLKQRCRILPIWRQKLLFTSRYHRHVIAAERALYQSPILKAIICNSQMVKKEIIEEFGISENKIHVIYNAINTQNFFPVNNYQRVQIRKNLSLPLGVHILIYVGSGFERKGLAAAIHAIANTHSYLLVIGRDKAEKKYRAIAKKLCCANRVIFAGIQVKVRPWYQASDGLLLPTLYDPCPNAIFEALACGLPVISSTTCGGSEFISPGINGYICDALDISALTDAIIALTTTGNSQSSIYSRAKVMPLSSKHLSQQLFSLYKKILD
ncbi:Glycosyl transferase group 1 family protein [Candidatus Erwinia haradaeae]|uniref:Glycosyl transferase group 1 family protein n=1 Tax=Candidatus Erwinia haradaeae TaxID=1922217 RepID=A0A451DCE7_9GAMM|nr:glycosyltransferase family 4 protein [Candidatus Erwinia haradaeae]VFP84074.1 Glycosyl transferase group 1 family protein [Candidatus Erwinia haradaeae]